MQFNVIQNGYRGPDTVKRHYFVDYSSASTVINCLVIFFQVFVRFQQCGKQHKIISATLPWEINALSHK